MYRESTGPSPIKYRLNKHQAQYFFPFSCFNFSDLIRLRRESEMSVFGGDSWGREAQYRKRKVDELLLSSSTVASSSSFKKLSSGKFVCLVCPHNPVLDSPLMLSVSLPPTACLINYFKVEGKITSIADIWFQLFMHCLFGSLVVVRLMKNPRFGFGIGCHSPLWFCYVMCNSMKYVKTKKR